MQTLKQNAALKIAIQLLFVLLAVTLLYSCSKEQQQAPALKEAQISSPISINASDRTSSAAIPFERDVYVSCANGGNGEYVRVKGSTNLAYTISWTDHGFTYGYHSNTYRIEAVGLTTGETFIGSGHTEGQVAASWVNEQWIATIIEQLKLIGKATSFVLKNTYHISVNPDGNVTVNLRDQKAECK